MFFKEKNSCLNLDTYTSLLKTFSFALMAPKLGIRLSLNLEGIIPLIGLLLLLKWLEILFSESKVWGVFSVVKVNLKSPKLGSLDFIEAHC